MSMISDNAILVNMSFMVNASENLVVISPVLRLAKNFIGNLYICSKYPSISGISILMDRCMRIHCLTKLTNVDVSDIPRNTASIIFNTSFC